MPVTIDGTKYLSAAEAALELKTTELKVLMLLRQNVLCGEEIEGCWLVTAESVWNFDPDSATPSVPSCASGCSSCGCK